MSSEIRLRSEWLSLLKGEFQQPYMSRLSAFLRAAKAAGKTIYPPAGQFFAALEATPPEAVKVVVLGQDPYHGPGQAHGLSFSVQGCQRIPPSLQNIFRELHDDIGMPVPPHGDLSQWAERGVHAVKVDLKKFLKPKKFGWRFIGCDLMMPNGLLVECYIAFAELMAVDTTSCARTREAQTDAAWTRSRTACRSSLSPTRRASRCQRFLAVEVRS